MSDQNNKDQYTESLRYFNYTIFVIFISFIVSLISNHADLFSIKKSIKDLTLTDFYFSIILLYVLFLIFHIIRNNKYFKKMTTWINKVFTSY
jgi:hypothetical protein